MTHWRSGIACTLALFWVLGCTLPAHALAGDILVQRDAGLNAAERTAVRAGAGVTLERILTLDDAEVVTVPDSREKRALAALNADPDVRYAMPDVPVHAAAAAPAGPSDQYYPFQWSLEQPNDADIDVLNAWGKAVPRGSGVTVAVVDQQIDVTHPDLKANIAPGGDDFREKACAAATPTGSLDHGTLVAGVIAATRDNLIGIAGIAPLAHVLPLPALDNCGVGSSISVIEAFDYAGEHGIPIVSASFATAPQLDVSRKADINTAFAAVLADHPNTLYVVAAGNEGNDNDENPVYPCNTISATRTDPENLVCVGMTGPTDVPVCSGNVGASVDVYAPGIDIWSTAAPNGYVRRSGTSMATPMVAAVAALLDSEDLGSHSAAALKDAVTGSGDHIAAVPGFTGRLNAARAVGADGDLGSGGPGPTEAWKTCDRDHDAVVDLSDECPDQPGTVQGCPDTDADLVRDTEDNCPGLANPGQADADGDGIGDACDITPRGDDVDGDAKAALDDRCPDVPSTAADGCPVTISNPPGGGGGPQVNPPVVTPTPAPVAATRILDLDVKVTPPKCPTAHPNCRKAAKVTVKLSRRATVALKLEMRVKKKGRWVWTGVTSKSLTATASGRSLTIRGKSGRSLAKGPYRVTASLSGVSSKTALNFRV